MDRQVFVGFTKLEKQKFYISIDSYRLKARDFAISACLDKLYHPIILGESYLSFVKLKRQIQVVLDSIARIEVETIPYLKELQVKLTELADRYHLDYLAIIDSKRKKAKQTNYCPSNRNISNRLKFELPEELYAQIKREAEDSRMPASRYLKQRILGYEMGSPEVKIKYDRDRDILSNKLSELEKILKQKDRSTARNKQLRECIKELQLLFTNR